MVVNNDGETLVVIDRDSHKLGPYPNLHTLRYLGITQLMYEAIYFEYDHLGSQWVVYKRVIFIEWGPLGGWYSLLMGPQVVRDFLVRNYL